MTFPRVAFLSYLAGTAAGLVLMATCAARAAYAITSGHRWPEFRKLRGK